MIARPDLAIYAALCWLAALLEGALEFMDSRLTTGRLLATVWLKG
ncbi:MAG: hypothetical protein WCJ21_06640 [Planctomycetota bacterium]